MQRIRILILSLLLASFAPSAETLPEREEGDYNFDGYTDYRVVRENPGNQCGWFDYYLYSHEAGQHRYVETAFCKEQFDAENQLVKTRVNGGMAGQIYYVRHYRWRGHFLVLVYAEKQDYDADRNLFVRTKIGSFESISGPTVMSHILGPAEASTGQTDD